MVRIAVALLATVSLSAIAAAQTGGTEPNLPSTSAQLKDPQRANVTIVAHVLEPTQVPPTPERLARLGLPDGFKISVFADGLINPRMIRVAADGTVYVTRRTVGDVVMLKDTDGDGRADITQVVASRPQMHGIEINGDTVYLTTVTDVYRTTRRADGTLEPLERIIDDLPEGGQHPNRMVVKGPDGKLYLSVGSTCNACDETNQENATMIQAEPDGSERKIIATGLRNTIGYGFEPRTGELYGWDQGIDWLGDNEQDEEFNHIVKGEQYGWPYIYADGKFNPQDDPRNGITMEELKAKSTNPIGLYVAHSAGMQMAFYHGTAFPKDYRNDAFIALRGSWNRKPPSGYEVLRVHFEDGKPVKFEPFITGFLMEDATDETGWTQMGRLAGLAEGPDGALYLSDDTNGVIYRITYEGDAAASEKMPASAPAVTNQDGARVTIAAAAAVSEPAASTAKSPALANALVTASGPPLTVTSTAFANGGMIPEIHAAEQEDVSPALEWTEGPQGTQSYAVLVEDPDAATDAPFVHWVAYDIPAATTALPEGFSTTPKVGSVEGLKQGANDAGRTGYYGMRPPIGDTAHTYHLMVFALDRTLALPIGATREELVGAMKGHVLAMGELTGTYQRNPTN